MRPGRSETRRADSAGRPEAEAVPAPGIPYEDRSTRFFERSVHFLARHWLLWANLLVGLYALLPWVSPLLRAVGWSRPGLALFLAYRPLCHQQPELCYRFLGYQVAYCQRDTAIYTSLFLGGLLFGLLRRRFRPLPAWVFLFAVAPTAVDGVTHLIELVFPDWSLRTQNRWAIALTGGVFPAWFYAGDGVGTLNWGLRTFSGLLFGLGLALTVYPYIEKEVRRTPGSPGRPGTTGGPGGVAFS